MLQQGKPGEAVAMLSEAAELHPEASALNDLAGALIAAGFHAEAEQRLRQAIEREPGFELASLNLGTLLLAGGRPAEALAPLRRVRALDTGRQALADAFLQLGNAAIAGYHATDAEWYYRQAIAERPDFTAAYGNLGNALVLQTRVAEALAAYRSGLALAPDHANIGFAYSLALLLAGNARDGWRYYENRRAVDPMRWNYDRRPALPQWHPGTDLAGKRVLLMAEQGTGDIIQYVRYAPVLAARGARVVLELPATLHRLFDTMPGVEQVITLDDPDPACDIACPLLSLPLICDGMIPADIPYARVPEDCVARWGAWLGPPDGRRRIGLVCSGDSRHPHDRLRSIPLARFAPLLGMRDCRFVLLQTDLREADAATRATLPGLRFPGVALGDFADTAGLIANLNLVVSIDTSVAHLAGALGAPTRLLLPFSPDYRWQLGRSDSPWYPSLQLYRQPAAGDWDTVIEAVRQDLDR